MSAAVTPPHYHAPQVLPMPGKLLLPLALPDLSDDAASAISAASAAVTASAAASVASAAAATDVVSAMVPPAS